MCESGSPSRSRPAQHEDGQSIPEIDNIWYEHQFQTTNRRFGSSGSHPSGECAVKSPITFVESFDSDFRAIGERNHECQPDVNQDRRQPRDMRCVHGWNNRNWRYRAGLRAGLSSSGPNPGRHGRTSDGRVGHAIRSELGHNVRGRRGLDRQAPACRGLDWREDEECSIAELNTIVDRYIAVKPRNMVTHDALADTVRALFPGDRVHRPLSRAMQALNAMLELHRPDLWIFGHQDRSAGGFVDGTRFQCLGEFRYCLVIRQ